MEHFVNKIPKQKLVIVVGISAITFTILALKFAIFWGTSLGVALLISVPVSAVLYFSETFRCVMSISLIKLAGPQSRLVFMTVISGLLLGGPIISIMQNLHEVQETTTCVGKILHEHSEDVKDAYTKAYKDMSNTIRNSIRAWKNVGEKIDSVIGPIGNALDTSAKALKDFEKSVQSVQDSCTRGVNTVRNQCRTGTAQAYQNCVNAIPSIQNTIGNPVINTGRDVGGQVTSVANKIGNVFGRKRRKRSAKDLQYVCESVRIGEASCNVFQATGFCTPLAAVKIPGLPNIPKELGKLANLFRLSVDSKGKLHQNQTSSTGNFSEKIKEIRSDFDQMISWIAITFRVVQVLLLFPLLVVPITSYQYLKGARKAFLGKGKVAIDQFFAKDSKKEIRGITTQVLLVLMHLILSFGILLVDYILYQSQVVAREHGGANFTATGNLEINIDVNAGPILTPIVDALVSTLTHEQSYTVDMSSNQCLPDPTPSTELRTVLLIVGLYVLMTSSFVFQAFLGSLKKRIVLKFLNLQNITHVAQTDHTKPEIHRSDSAEQSEKTSTGAGTRTFNFIGTNSDKSSTVIEMNKLNQRLNCGY